MCDEGVAHRNEVNMSEKLVIVSKRRTAGKKIFDIALFVVTCILLLLAMIAPVFFAIPAVLGAVLWYFLSFRSDIEYEYTYYDGEFRFAKIRAKSRRKSLGEVQMEDVLAFAPKGDRSVYKYENDKSLGYKNLTSGNPDAKVYELVFKGEKGISRYEIEPDEEMMDTILVKYSRLVIK